MLICHSAINETELLFSHKANFKFPLIDHAKNLIECEIILCIKVMLLYLDVSEVKIIYRVKTE